MEANQQRKLEEVNLELAMSNAPKKPVQPEDVSGNTTATGDEQRLPNTETLPCDDLILQQRVKDVELRHPTERRSSGDDVRPSNVPQITQSSQSLKRRKFSEEVKAKKFTQEHTIKDCIEALGELSEFVPVGSKLYYEAVKSFLEKDNREVFMCLPAEARHGWLEFLMK